VICVDEVCDGAIGLLRVRLEQLGSEVALLLGGEVPAVDVRADDKRAGSVLSLCW
jgi:hypothetical protein